MPTVHGTVKDGKIVVDAPADWPEGMEVEVRPTADDEEPPGTIDPQADNSPEGIARWLAWYDTMKPLQLTPEDEERIRKAREEQRAFELATWEEQSEKLRKMWE